MDDLIAFLLARLGEDERVTEAVEIFSPLYWVTLDGSEGFVITVDELLNMPEEDVAVGRPPAAAKVKHDGPWRTLPNIEYMMRDIESKRRILHEHSIIETKAIGEGMQVVDIKVCQTCSNKQGVPCQTVRLLAMPYADHEDYRDEWRP